MSKLTLTLSKHFTNRFQTFLAAAFVALIALFSTGLGSAQAASTKSITLGKANMAFDPNCGRSFERECLAEGRLTGYQALSKKDSGRNFVVPYAGKIVSWTIKLANPTRKDVKVGETTHGAQLPFFNGYFGSPAQARIAVLKRVEKKKKGPPRYKMVRQSPVQVLNPYFGTTVQFALSKPLNVIKNQVIGLTIPTWAPAMWRPAACNASVYESPECQQASEDYTWRASRAPDKCSLQAQGDTKEQIEAKIAGSHPQQKVGSVKRYGCYYGGNVLTYSATIVAK